MYIRNPIQKTFITLSVVAGIGIVAYAAYKIEERDEKRRQAAFTAQAKVQVLAETATKLQKAVETYKGKMAELGIALPPGKVISIEDLEQSKVLSREELEHLARIEKFAYILLPFDAPDKEVQMVLITNRGRATMNKKGEGALYER